MFYEVAKFTLVTVGILVLINEIGDEAFSFAPSPNDI